MAKPTDLPSGCQDALQRGFNLLRGDFLGNPVFDYSPNGTVVLGGTTYAIPKTVVAEEVNRSKTCETTLMLQTQEDYKTSSSLSVSASMSYGIYSMSASSSLTSADELLTSSWTASDRICPAGAIFLPVPRGTSYQALAYRDIVDAITSLNWTPLTLA